MLFAVAVSALSLLSSASAQQTQLVQVGSVQTATGGVFQFIPPSFNATNGTVVTFQFIGAPGNHTVTQSTFADPCDPVAGGFDSGWVFVPQSPALAQTPEWNLTITDDSKPIWFYCKQLSPAPHCSSGMVGAINAPASGNTFAAFQSAAKSFGKTPGQGEGGLVGLGASASAGVGPIPTGATAYTGVPLATSSGTGSASSPAGTATSAKTSPSTSAPASSANSLAANSIFALFAAALGFVLA